MSTIPKRDQIASNTSTTAFDSKCELSTYNKKRQSAELSWRLASLKTAEQAFEALLTIKGE